MSAELSGGIESAQMVRAMEIETAQMIQAMEAFYTEIGISPTELQKQACFRLIMTFYSRGILAAQEPVDPSYAHVRRDQ